MSADTGRGSLRNYLDAAIDGIAKSTPQGTIGIVQLSLGPITSGNEYDPTSHSLETRDNLVLVAASGNSNRPNPSTNIAGRSYVVSVAAAETAQTRASFTNFARETTVAQYGVDIPVGGPNHQYTKMSGTSYSAPLTAALLVAFAAYLREEGKDVSSASKLIDFAECVWSYDTSVNVMPSLDAMTRDEALDVLQSIGLTVDEKTPVDAIREVLQKIGYERIDRPLATYGTSDTRKTCRERYY